MQSWWEKSQQNQNVLFVYFEEMKRDLPGVIRKVASFLGVDRSIVEGRIEDDKISFTTRTEEVAGDETRPTEHHYLGSLVGEEIRFVMQTEGGFSAHPPVELVAKRLPELP